MVHSRGGDNQHKSISSPPPLLNIILTGKVKVLCFHVIFREFCWTVPKLPEIPLAHKHAHTYSHMKNKALLNGGRALQGFQRLCVELFWKTSWIQNYFWQITGRQLEDKREDKSSQINSGVSNVSKDYLIIWLKPLYRSFYIVLLLNISLLFIIYTCYFIGLL